MNRFLEATNRTYFAISVLITVLVIPCKPVVAGQVPMIQEARPDFVRGTSMKAGNGPISDPELAKNFYRAEIANSAVQRLTRALERTPVDVLWSHSRFLEAKGKQNARHLAEMTSR